MRVFLLLLQYGGGDRFIEALPEKLCGYCVSIQVMVSPVGELRLLRGQKP